MNNLHIDWPSISAMGRETAKRRMVWPDPDMNKLTITHPDSLRRGHATLHWIEEHTTGLFYLGGSTVAFKDEQDEIMFRLSFK